MDGKATKQFEPVKGKILCLPIKDNCPQQCLYEKGLNHRRYKGTYCTKRPNQCTWQIRLANTRCTANSLTPIPAFGGTKIHLKNMPAWIIHHMGKHKQKHVREKPSVRI